MFIYISLQVTGYFPHKNVLLMQLLRAVEGTGLHLCHYRRAEFATSLYTFILMIYMCSLLILTVCLVCIYIYIYIYIYSLCIEYKLRPVLCCINLILSVFKVAWIYRNIFTIYSILLDGKSYTKMKDIIIIYLAISFPYSTSGQMHAINQVIWKQWEDRGEDHRI